VGTLASLAADGQGPSYDLVTIHHVLEHLLDPVASMRQLAALVRPGGRVLVEVPDIEADWHTPGRLFHAAHLYWFSEATLAALALRCGLEPVQVLRVPPCGHLCMLLRRPSRLHAPAGWRVPLAGNAQRVAAALGGRSLRRYLLSAAPYRRAAGRLALRFGEWRAVRGVRDATAVVDSLCTSWLASRANHGTVMLAR
jgi:SAM-dependent methyltransferase